MRYQGQELASPQSIVDAFAAFFKSVFVNFNSYAIMLNNVLPNKLNLSTLTLTRVTEEKNFSAVKGAKDAFTTGPDGVFSFIGSRISFKVQL